MTSEFRNASSGCGVGDRKPCTADADVEGDFGEEVDEDQMSEDECQVSFQNFVQRKTAKENPATDKLLNFLESVNCDIQKYFSRNKGSEDSCDVYQDKWTSGKSGRELYYADLMKIAQGLENDDPKSPPKTDQGIVRDHKNVTKVVEAHSGRLDWSRGLGPLSGLFDCDSNNEAMSSKKLKGGKVNHQQGKRPRSGKQEDCLKKSRTLPMAERKLPHSFWREPKQCALPKRAEALHLASVINNNNNVNPRKLQQRPPHGHTSGVEALGHTNVPPDFGDLLDCWGEVTHMASSCPPGGHHTNHGPVTRASAAPPTAAL